MKLFMSGKSFKASHIPPLVGRIIKALDNSANGELFNTFQVSYMVKCSHELLRQNNGFFVGYFHVWKNKKYWGNRATITQFKKEVGKE